MSSMANDSPTSILVYGSDLGMLGPDLIGEIRRRRGVPASGRTEDYVVGRDLPDFDATNEEAVREDFEQSRPDVVYNCAAYTNVDGCEENVKAAYDCNEVIPRNLARACKEHGALLVHVSTDFVFDGEKDEPYREEDATNPLSVYGKSKLAGERAVIESGCEYLICRTAWLYGAHGKNFVTTMLRLAAERPEVAVVADQFGSPTWTADLARMMLTLVEKEARGIVHTANAGRASWCDLAREAIRLAGLDTKVKPIAAADYPRKARLPVRSSVLATDKYAALTGQAPRDWHDALRQFVASRDEKGSGRHSTFSAKNVE